MTQRLDQVWKSRWGRTYVLRIVVGLALLLSIAGIFLTKVDGTWPKVLGAALMLCLPVALVLLGVATVQAWRSGEGVTWGPRS